jgi:hypothetical protein
MVCSIRGRIECYLGTEIPSVGRGVEGSTLGDRVVSNGKRAEVVTVPNPVAEYTLHGFSGPVAAVGQTAIF